VFFSRSHDAVIRGYDEADNVIQMHEHKATSKSHDRIEAYYWGDRKAGFKFAIGGAFRDLIWSHFGHTIVWQKFLVRVRKAWKTAA
jgi:hypothetical protein